MKFFTHDLVFWQETVKFRYWPSLYMNQSSQLDFEKLFREHHHALCNLAYNLLRDKEGAKDVVQEVFLKLWKNKTQLEFGQQIKHYLFKATVHTAMNHLRFTKKIMRIDDEMIVLSASPDRNDVGFKELELRARLAVDKLPPKCKTIYILSRHEGLKYQEIADTLNLSVKTVENQMGIALEKLRHELKPFLTAEFLVMIALLASMLFAFFS